MASIGAFNMDPERERALAQRMENVSWVGVPAAAVLCVAVSLVAEMRWRGWCVQLPLSDTGRAGETCGGARLLSCGAGQA